MQKWNIPTDKAQRVNGKNGIICLVIICLFPELWSLKCQKWLIFCIFCWCQQNSHSFDIIFTCIWKILFNSLRKCYVLLGSELTLARYQPLKIQSFIILLLIPQFFDISILVILQTVTPKRMNDTNTNEPFFSFLHFKTFKIQFHAC